MNPILVLQLVTVVCVLILGFFVLRKNPHSSAHKYFWAFTMSVVGWNTSLFFAISEIGQSTPWARLVFFFGGFIPISLYLFSKTFLSGNAQLGILDRILAGTGVIIALGSGTGLVVKSARSMDHLYLIGDFSKLMPIHFAYFFGVLIWAFIILISKHRRAKSQEKLHLKYVILGFLSFFIPFLFTNIVLPNSFGIFEYNNLGPIFTLPMVFLIAYAIVKHQLLDIRVIIQRGIVYSLVFVVIVALYLGTIFITESFFKETATLADIVSAGIATVIGVITVPFIEKYFRRVTDKIFFKDKYDYSKAMYDLSEILNHNIDLDVLIRKMCDGLKTILRAKSADITLFSDEPPRTAVKDEWITVPIILESKKLGEIILGPKLSGDPYTQEDFTLLKTLSYQPAIAIEKA
ncbi:MAG: histidine kinase N-terminal 7TM domain-containing protein, partial [Candidatus Liptonbacteria bacterium]|nr:histidine kinase N-terminal 7TM domain-containing protein [Candidatus Liptonbacteria bacterium]